MTFDEILPELKNGKVVRRTSYDKKFVIFLQIPVEISAELCIGLRSVPKDMKLLLLDSDRGISYENQFIIYDFVSKMAHNYTFSCMDLCASDWEVVDISAHYKYVG